MTQSYGENLLLEAALTPSSPVEAAGPPESIPDNILRFMGEAPKA